jgi:hypothetical protein
VNYHNTRKYRPPALVKKAVKSNSYAIFRVKTPTAASYNYAIFRVKIPADISDICAIFRVKTPTTDISDSYAIF